MFPTKVVVYEKIYPLCYIQFLSKIIIFREKWNNALKITFYTNSISSDCKRKMLHTKVVGKTQTHAKLANQGATPNQTQNLQTIL